MEPEMMTPEEVGAALQIKERKLAEWRRDGFGPPWTSWGRKSVRYNRKKFAVWLATQ